MDASPFELVRQRRIVLWLGLAGLIVLVIWVAVNPWPSSLFAP